MQTMPTRNRTSLIVTGAAVLVLVVGLIVYGVGQRTPNEAKNADPMSGLAEAPNGVDGKTGSGLSAQPGSGLTAGDTATPGAGTVGAGVTPSANGSTAAGTTTEGLTQYNSVPAEHVVQNNETLYTISQKYYNTHVYAGDIEALNQLEDPNAIVAGMKLQLPRVEDLSGQ